LLYEAENDLKQKEKDVLDRSEEDLEILASHKLIGNEEELVYVFIA